MRWLKITVLPLPVARERPRRRAPWETLVRTEVIDSSWYGRSWMVGVPLLWLGVAEVDESLAYCIVESRRGGGPVRPLDRIRLPCKAVAKEHQHLEMSVGRM